MSGIFLKISHKIRMSLILRFSKSLKENLLQVTTVRLICAKYSFLLAKTVTMLFELFYLSCFICHLAAPFPNLGYYRGDSIIHPMIVNCWLEGNRELRNEVRSLGPAECLAGIEPGTFRFLCNALIHQATLWSKTCERNFVTYAVRYFKGCYWEEYTETNFYK